MDIQEIKKLGLWPQSKKTTSQKGVVALEKLGYKLFYIGKNADLYTTPSNEAKILLVRSDRCSVFDIPLNLEIQDKGIVQTSISKSGAKFAKNIGINTAILDDIIDDTLTISSRCQMMKLCKPLEAKIDNDTVQFEFIFRNYLTGSLYESYKNNKDPYSLNLPKNLQQWAKFDIPLFTPTTKGIKDEPLNSSKVKNIFPDIISKLEELFIKFTKFAYDNDIVVIDTKFEVFVDENDQWILGDEILTPESSRFIAKDDFHNKNYLSMDKQILRNFAKQNSWKEKSNNLKAGEKLDVDVSNDIKESILNNYKIIDEKLCIN